MDIYAILTILILVIGFYMAWNIGANTPTWSNDPNFTAQTNNLQGQLSGPFTMIRILINSGAGTGASVTGRFVTPFNAGRIN